MTDNRATETATSCIIATLRERNVQFATHGNTDRVWWTAENGVTWYAQDRPNSNDLFVKLEAVLTPEQAIAATLGSGTLTAEQVEKAIRDCSTYASYDGCTYYASGIRLQAIADELNATLGGGECEWVLREKWLNRKGDDHVYGYETGCGTKHTWWPDSLPNFCPTCGGEVKVVDA